MVYFLSYLTLGMVLVTLKSPFRSLVDHEVEDLKMHSWMRYRDIDEVKVILYRILLSFILVAIYPLILYRKLEDLYCNFMYGPDNYYKRIVSQPEWLTDEISKKEAEVTHSFRMNGHNVPFGYNNDQWLNLLEVMKEGDRLYAFRSPEETWQSFAGKEGVALVRKGAIVADAVNPLD